MPQSPPGALSWELVLTRRQASPLLTSNALTWEWAQLGSNQRPLVGQRIDAARTLLEQTDLPVEAIATRVGLASAVNLRRRFRAALGAYRRAFGEAHR